MRPQSPYEMNFAIEALAQALEMFCRRDLAHKARLGDIRDPCKVLDVRLPEVMTKRANGEAGK